MKVFHIIAACFALAAQAVPIEEGKGVMATQGSLVGGVSRTLNRNLDTGYTGGSLNR